MATTPEVLAEQRELAGIGENYEETFGFPTLGRNATIGVRIAAGR